MLINLIRQHIETHGFMRVDEYMHQCLLHPEHGYYTNRTVFGAEGDFTTAPEISQLFGEMLGIWAVLQWQYLGTPQQFNVIELGPGRGTLMRDFVRATAHVAPFAKAMQIHMVEASPRLQHKQREMLKHTSCPVMWHDAIDTLPFDKPVIILANEFFDALPIRQYIMHDGAWHERVIILKDDTLIWDIRACDGDILALPITAKNGEIAEVFSQSNDLFLQLCDHIRMAQGVMAVIDYGDYVNPRIGDTLQALKNHQSVSIFETPGQADITAHVDFHSFENLAQHTGLHAACVSQRQFLKDNGIDIRFQNLRSKTQSDEELDVLRSGYDRLINPHYMGHLFKVLTVKTP
jgi:NADH dehydrogenase [ubiquinone] 1 alpha subcomplex assembly factor 7